MDSSQRTLALRLADALDELDSAFSATGVCGEAADLLRELAAEPRKRIEEDAFEDWLEKECPSGDVDEVQRKWEASEALAELLDEQRKQAERDALEPSCGWEEEALRYCENADYWREKYEALARKLDAVREVYAGMEGFVAQTAPEGYCLRIIEQMAKAAMKGASNE